MSYSDLLRDPRWQKKRLEVLERDEWRCRDCCDTTTELHVHHTYYAKGRKPWEYETASLKTLCKPCHEKLTEYLDELKAATANMPADLLVLLCGFAGILNKVAAYEFAPADECESVAASALMCGMPWKDYGAPGGHVPTPRVAIEAWLKRPAADA